MQFGFDGIIELIDVGGRASVSVCLPKYLVPELPFYKTPRLRVCCEINGLAVDGVCQASGKGLVVLVLGRNFLKEVDLKVGDEVAVLFDVVDITSHHTTRRRAAESALPRHSCIDKPSF